MRPLLAGLSTALLLPSCALLAQAPGQPSAQARSTGQQQAHDDHGQRPSPERVHRYEQQAITLDNFEATGYILDIGGGGEGVIGQVKPSQVVAIDLSARELRGEVLNRREQGRTFALELRKPRQSTH